MPDNKRYAGEGTKQVLRRHLEAIDDPRPFGYGELEQPNTILEGIKPGGFSVEGQFWRCSAPAISPRTPREDPPSPGSRNANREAALRAADGP